MMKGPGGRLKFDIRRLWECPVCHRRELTTGDVVNRLCTCSAKSDPPRQNWMKLLEPKPARPVLPQLFPSSAPLDSAVQVVEIAQQSPPTPPPDIAAQIVEVAQQSPPTATPPSPTEGMSTPHDS
jgi:hypothetical protein